MSKRIPLTTTLNAELLRQSKAISALDGMKLNDFIEDAMREKLIKRAKTRS